MPEALTTPAIRVARIITRLNIGGPAIQAIEMSARLETVGYHTLLIHGRLGPGEGDMQYLVASDHRFETAQVPALRRDVAPFADVGAVARVFQLLSRFRPAIIHTHTAKAGTVGRAAGLAYNATVGRRTPARFVHTYHGHVLDGYFSSPTTATFAAIERFLGRHTDTLIAVSSSVQRQLELQHQIGSRFRIVPLGFDLSRFAAINDDARASARPEFGLGADARVVAFVGRLTAIKQPLLFMQSAARIARADPCARFLVAGGGELERDMRTAAHAMGLGDRVQFLGWRRDLVPVYAAADVLALTSRNEGTPVALIESMAAGIAAACFDVGGVPDVITVPDLGVLVPPDDVDALGAAITNLFADERRRRAIGSRARASALSRFGIDRLVHDVDTLYRELVK